MAKLNVEMPKLKLSDGYEIPVLGFGTGTALSKKSGSGAGGILSSIIGSNLDKDLVANIETAIKVGYRHLDAAESYNNEEELGAAIKNSKVPRSEFFITTKVESSLPGVEAALDTSLKKLGLDYVDLYLIHSPFSNFPDKATLQSTWKEMEAVQRSGKTRSIGVSNFLQSHLETVLETAEIKPVMNQTEFHAYLSRGDLVAWSKSKGIATSAYGPITPATKAKPGPVDDLLEQLTKKYGVDESEICLRWCIDQDVVAITTSSKESRLSGYLRVHSFKLTPKEVEDISKAGMQKHFRGFWGKKFDENDRS